MTVIEVKTAYGVMRAFAGGKVVAIASRQDGDAVEWPGWVVMFPVPTAADAEAVLRHRAKACSELEPFGARYFLEGLHHAPGVTP